MHVGERHIQEKRLARALAARDEVDGAIGDLTIEPST
jgi:hypothetical protein